MEGLNLVKDELGGTTLFKYRGGGEERVSKTLESAGIDAEEPEKQKGAL